MTTNHPKKFPILFGDGVGISRIGGTISALQRRLWPPGQRRLFF